MLSLSSSTQTAISQNSSLTIPQSSILAEANINPNWDWTLGDDPSRIYPDAAYLMYHKSDNTTIYAHYVDAPWTHPANSTAGLGDNKKEDGWVLLTRDFGTPTRGITGVGTGSSVPYFLLYNKFRSTARIFILAQNDNTWNKGFVEIKFQNPSDSTKTPAVLAHFKPIVDAIDRLTNMKDNVNSIFSNILQKNVWLWADFPLSYDPTITPKPGLDPPRFFVTVYGQQLSNISIKGISQGVSGNARFVNDWLTGSGLNNGNGSVGIPNLKMPNVDFGQIDINLGDYQFKPLATHVNWGSFANYFKKIKIRVPQVDINNPFRGLFDGFSAKLSSFTDVLPISLPGLDIGGLFDFFVNGGTKQLAPAEPAPTYIAMNLELAGTIESTLPIHHFQITIPGTRDEFWKPTYGSPVGIVRNEPVGILTLTKTPKIYKKQYIEHVFDYTDPIRGDVFNEIPFDEYEIAEDIQIQLNQSANLNIVKTEISIIVDYLSQYPVSRFISWASLHQQNHLVELESPINLNGGSFRSMPVPIKYAKGRTIQSPSNGSSNVRLKIKSILKRKDDPNAQPVVFISSYNVEIVDYDGPNSQPLPTIPPQNPKCNIPSSGGVRVSWDRNPEKNIKFYAVERSINGGSYIQVGTTPDTVFTDNEVQKAVKPYQSNRQNVSVNYRARAKSEWIEDNGTVRSQFSLYSDIINIHGSIMALLGKQDFTKIVPESNSISQNFPNPFNPTTTIYYSVKEEGPVTVTIFNTLGQEVFMLVNEKKNVGHHYAEWNAVNMPSGVYFYRISNGKYSETKRMILTK